MLAFRVLAQHGQKTLSSLVLGQCQRCAVTSPGLQGVRLLSVVLRPTPTKGCSAGFRLVGLVALELQGLDGKTGPPQHKPAVGPRAHPPAASREVPALQVPL